MRDDGKVLEGESRGQFKLLLHFPEKCEEVHDILSQNYLSELIN
jgi:hypothetical protein